MRITNEWFESERQKAIQWADMRLRLAELKASDPENEAGQGFVILDTETTGTDGGAEPVQITMIDHLGRPLLNTYVKPGCKIEYGAMKVHGISEDMVRLAPKFPEVMGAFREVVKNKIVICYNLDFDRRIIRQTVAKYHLPPPVAAGYECAMMRYAQYHGELKKGSNTFRWHKLTDACRYMQIEREAEHESLVDCMATLQLMQAMALANNSKSESVNE